MKKYSENLKKQFKDLIKTDEIQDGNKKKEFAEKKVLPFLFQLVDEIVENDNLEKLQHELTEDAGIKMAINKSYKQNSFCIEKNYFFDNWNTQSIEYALEADLLTAFHEARHHKQHKLLTENDILKMSPHSSIFAKEQMIILFDYDFYRSNHDEFLMEIDARNSAYKDSSDFVDSAIPNSEYAERYRVFHDAEFHAPISAYFENSDYGIPNKSHFISAKFDDVLKTIPKDQLPFAFEDYPVLGLIYHEDGTKKNIEEIEFMYKEIITSNSEKLNNEIEIDGYKTTLKTHINKIFKTIIKSDKELFEAYEKYLASEKSKTIEDVEKIL